jgi:hypothetical protein
LEPISLHAEHARKCLKVECLSRIEYDFQKSRVTGSWDHKVSVSTKKVKKKCSCLCTFKDLANHAGVQFIPGRGTTSALPRKAAVGETFEWITAAAEEDDGGRENEQVHLLKNMVYKLSLELR